jgi:hypothetical protein
MGLSLAYNDLKISDGSSKRLWHKPHYQACDYQLNVFKLQ